MSDTKSRPEGFGRTALSPAFTHGQPLIWKRTDAGLQTNVRWKVRHHSPDGYEVGYGGSGPADLALNMMAALFPRLGDNPVKCFDGQVSRAAWALHQDFKSAFLAGADRRSGQIEWETIAAWLALAAEKNRLVDSRAYAA